MSLLPLSKIINRIFLAQTDRKIDEQGGNIGDFLN